MDKKEEDKLSKQDEPQNDDKQERSASAANLDAIIQSPTEAVRSHLSGGNMANTGTNVTYDTSAMGGGGGSAGTGYTDNQTGSAPETNSSDDAEQSAILRSKSNDEDTIGNP